LSPPRKKNLHPRIDSSPPRKTSSPDLSPPRKRKSVSKMDNSSLSPPRRNIPTDLSPPRRKQTYSAKSPSPLRRTHSPDLSPPRKNVTIGSPSLSPRRRKIASHNAPNDVSDDLSPPRKSSHMDLSSHRRRHVSSEKRVGDSLTVGKSITHDLSPPRKSQKKDIMADGTAAGLWTGGQLAREMEMKKQEKSKRYLFSKKEILNFYLSLNVLAILYMNACIPSSSIPHD
jgi:pre-mRNA-splicing factor CWC26